MTELWCVHVIGPDNIYAAPSLAAACRAAQRFNTYWAKKYPGDEYQDVLLWANVTQWPYHRDNHATDMKRPHTDEDVFTAEERAAFP